MELFKALPAHQHPTGSWDPIGAWGEAGGRVYSTAIGAASLLAPWAHERIFGARTWLHPPYDQARAALEKACEDKDAGVAAAAKAAVERIRPIRARAP